MSFLELTRGRTPMFFRCYGIKSDPTSCSRRPFQPLCLKRIFKRHLCIIAAVLLSFIYSASCDLPPHCLHGDILGDWDIHKGYWYPCSQNRQLTPDPLCGFNIPDIENSHGAAGQVYPNISTSFSLEEVLHLRFTPTRVVPLDDTETPLASTNSDDEDEDEDDTAKQEPRSFDWTIVYDEGIDFFYRGVRFFAYFKYMFIGPNRVRSYCSTTMVGWWVPEEPPTEQEKKKGLYRGCWWGLKKFHANGSRVDPRAWTNEIAAVRPSLGVIGKHDPLTATVRDIVESILRKSYGGRKEDNGTLNGTPEEGGIHLQWKPVAETYVTMRDKDVTTLQELNRLSGMRRAYLSEADDISATDEELMRSGEQDESAISADNEDESSKQEEKRNPKRRLSLNGDKKPLLFRNLRWRGKDTSLSRQFFKLKNRKRRLTISSYLPLVSLPVLWKYGPDMDWTNPLHVERQIGVRRSMVPDVLSQGSCGSCYAVSAATMLTSRLWIRYKHDPRIAHRVYVSSVPMVQCTPYSQGCEGGYIYLGIKYAEEHGLPTTECVEKTKAQSLEDLSHLVHGHPVCIAVEKQMSRNGLRCSSVSPSEALKVIPHPSCRLRVKAARSHYIGGSYGKASEASMREALHLRGPIAASFEPSPEFPVYRSGVFHTPLALMKEYRPGDEGFPWEKVDHAVVIVGHGVSIDPLTGIGLPYWKVMNSWGPSWGERGFFRIVRGVDELSIESIALEATPKIVYNKEF